MQSYTQAHVASPELIRWILGDSVDERTASVARTYIPRLAAQTPADVNAEIAGLEASIAQAVDDAVSLCAGPVNAGEGGLLGRLEQQLLLMKATLAKTGECVQSFKTKDMPHAQTAIQQCLETRSHFSQLSSELGKLQELIGIPDLISQCADQGLLEEAVDLGASPELVARTQQRVWPSAGRQAAPSASSRLRVFSVIKRLNMQHDWMANQLQVFTKRRAALVLAGGASVTRLDDEIRDFVQEAAIVFGDDRHICELLSRWLLVSSVPTTSTSCS